MDFIIVWFKKISIPAWKVVGNFKGERVGSEVKISKGREGLRSNSISRG